MTSRFGILFQEARNTVRARPLPTMEGEPQLKIEWVPPGLVENFLTETLALAIQSDWQPMAKLLLHIDIVDASQPIESLRPYTQQRLLRGSDRGDRPRLDLVLAIDNADPDVAEIWVEVKAGSPISGDQIERYLLAIKEAQDGVPRRLVILGGTQGDWLHSDGYPVQVFTWAEFAAIAATATPVWRAFGTFITERSLTESPVSPSSAGLSVDWLAEAIAGALVPPIGWCNWEISGDRERTRRSVLARLKRNQRDLGMPVIQRWAPGQCTQIHLGVGDAQDRNLLSVRLAVTAAYGIPHEVLRRRAQVSMLVDAGWRAGDGRDDDVILAITRSFDDEAPHDGAAWLREQLTALQNADLLLDLDGDGCELSAEGVDPVREPSADGA